MNTVHHFRFIVDKTLFVVIPVKRVSAIRYELDGANEDYRGWSNQDWFKARFNLVLELNIYIPKFVGKIPIDYKLYFPDNITAVEWKLRWL